MVHRRLRGDRGGQLGPAPLRPSDLGLGGARGSVPARDPGRVRPHRDAGRAAAGRPHHEAVLRSHRRRLLSRLRGRWPRDDGPDRATGRAGRPAAGRRRHRRGLPLDGDRHGPPVPRRAGAATAKGTTDLDRPTRGTACSASPGAVRDDLRLPAVGRGRHSAARLRGVGARRIPLPGPQRAGAVPGPVRHVDQRLRAGVRLPRGREAAGPVRRARRPLGQPARPGRPAPGEHRRRRDRGGGGDRVLRGGLCASRSPTSPSSTA